MTKVLIVSGEPSGDIFASGLIRALRKFNKGIYVYAMGGKNSASAGAELIANIDELSVMGFTEVICRLKKIRNTLNKVSDWIAANKPDAVILVDFPTFNFKIAKLAGKLGIPVVYFIPPKIWASRYKRINFIKKYVKFVIVIFPFEYDIYKKAGIDAYYFGNPLYVLYEKENKEAALNEVKQQDCIGHVVSDHVSDGYASLAMTKENKDIACGVGKKIDLNNKYPIISFLPGSRKTELKYHADRVVQSLLLIKTFYKNAFFIFPFRKEIDSSYFRTVLKNKNISAGWYAVTDSVSYALSSCDIAVVASGTASLEACFYNKPVIIVYYLNYLTYLLAKILVRIKYVGLINILADSFVVPELIESKFTPENVFKEVDKFLKDDIYKKGVLDKISGIISTLKTDTDPFEASAGIIYDKILKDCHCEHSISDHVSDAI
ncbi:MAG: lipid-A-disaccharide synthase [bacterium]